MTSDLRESDVAEPDSSPINNPESVEKTSVPEPFQASKRSKAILKADKSEKKRQRRKYKRRKRHVSEEQCFSGLSNHEAKTSLTPISDEEREGPNVKTRSMK